ncbi:MAG: hypothetical protein ACFFAL_03170 [Promethearchaeota archaeon]
MSDEMALQASSEIVSLASKYIIISVVAVAFGAVSLVYSVLAFLVYGYAAIQLAVLGGLFIGVAFIAIGVFLTFWGLYWMRSEGKRMKKRFKSPPPK